MDFHTWPGLTSRVHKFFLRYKKEFKRNFRNTKRNLLKEYRNNRKIIQRQIRVCVRELNRYYSRELKRARRSSVWYAGQLRKEYKIFRKQGRFVVTEVRNFVHKNIPELSFQHPLYKVGLPKISRDALVFSLAIFLVFSSLFPGTPLEIREARADATSAKSPTAQANDGWTSSNLMQAQDGSSATAPAITAIVDQITFGFTATDIPAGATIDGVTVEIDNHKTGTNTNRLIVNLLNAGTCTAVNLTQDSVDDSTYDVLGGATNTWSCTALTQANIVSSAFGVTITASKVSGPNPAAGTWFVDHVRVTVNFTAADATNPVPGATGTITTADVATTSLTLNWTKGTDNVTTQANLQYEVRQSSSANIDTVANIEANGSIINAYTADIATFGVSGLSPANTYYFNVIIKDEAGNKAAYTMKSETTASDSTNPVPGATGTITTADVATTSLTLNWTK
ncbi:MAG: hypothetical protein Q8P37_00750, partial [Candidatus Spechtbacteria bacterium]|nr:hypothetical protein [Candidatus Spechtbacteria bacterium]